MLDVHCCCLLLVVVMFSGCWLCLVLPLMFVSVYCLLLLFGVCSCCLLFDGCCYPCWCLLFVSVTVNGYLLLLVFDVTGVVGAGCSWLLLLEVVFVVAGCRCVCFFVCWWCCCSILLLLLMLCVCCCGPSVV